MWVRTAVVKDLWQVFLSTLCLYPLPYKKCLTSVASGHCSSLLIALKILEGGAGIWLVEDDVSICCDYKAPPHSPGLF